MFVVLPNRPVQLGQKALCFTTRPLPAASKTSPDDGLPPAHVRCGFGCVTSPWWLLLKYQVSRGGTQWPGTLRAAASSVVVVVEMRSNPWLPAHSVIVWRSVRNDNSVSCISVPSSAVSEAVQLLCHHSFWCGIKLSWCFQWEEVCSRKNPFHVVWEKVALLF